MTALENEVPPEQRLKTLIGRIVAEMVDHPEDVDVKLDRGERTHVYTLFVNKEDLGKMIGRNGQNIGALRHLLKTWLGKHSFRAVIDLEES